MFEVIGIMYAGSPMKDIRVVSARVRCEHRMFVTFSTGETRLFDITPLLNRPASAPLASQKTFAAYEIDHGFHGSMARLISRPNAFMNKVMSIGRLHSLTVFRIYG